MNNILFDPTEIKQTKITKKVHKCTFENKTYVIKECNGVFSMTKEYLLTELANIISEQTPQKYFMTIKEGNKYLVMEYIECKTLFKWSDKNILMEAFDLDIIIKIMKNILTLISKFHSFGFYHRDLKGKNILIDSNHSIYLIDFGDCYVDKDKFQEKFGLDISKYKICFNKKLNIFTPLHCPPEGIQYRLCGGDDIDWEKYEVYCIASTICQTLHKMNEDQFDLLSTLLKNIKEKNPINIDDIYKSKSCIYNTKFDNEILGKLITSMLDEDPNKRPTIKECLETLDSINL